MNSNPYDAFSSSNVVRSDEPQHVTDIAATVSSRFKTTVIAVGAWQLACLVLAFVYRHLIGHLVVAAYTELFGEIQTTYGNYERVATYVGLLVITLPATVVTMTIVDKLSGCHATSKRKMATFACWQLATMLVLASSYEFGFPYMINQLGWQLFGPPTEIYSFQNLVLHRIIAWLLCTVPVVWLAISTYIRFSVSTLGHEKTHNGRVTPAHTAEQSDAVER